MPLVDIEIALKIDEVIPNELAIALADELGEIFDPPRRDVGKALRADRKTIR